MADPNRGNYIDLNQILWYRQFIRGIDTSTEKPYPDKDTPATQEQLENDFVDFWGKKLKSDKKFRQHNTYNELMTEFWGNSSGYWQSDVRYWRDTEDPNFILQTYAVADGQTVQKYKQ